MAFGSLDSAFMTESRLAKGDPEMRPEYELTGAERGRLQRRFGPHAALVALRPEVTRVFGDAETAQCARRLGQRVGALLDPDAAEVFTDSAQVNDVLRTVARLVQDDRRRRRKKPVARR